MKYICGHQGKISRTCGWNILVNFCCLLSRLLSKHPQPTAMRRHLPLISTIQVPASGFKHEYQHFTVIITMRSTQHACGWAWGSGNRVTWAQNVYASHLIWPDGVPFTNMRFETGVFAQQAKEFSFWWIPMRSPWDGDWRSGEPLSIPQWWSDEDEKAFWWNWVKRSGSETLLSAIAGPVDGWRRK